MARETSSLSLFRRYEHNPILTPAQWPYPVAGVFNPGVASVDGETILLVRVEDSRGFSHLTVARSADGKTNWEIDPKPTLVPERAYQEERWGIEDPRIVYLEDRKAFAITYVSFSKGGPLVSLALTEDFKEFKRVGPLVPPEDKDASLFPKKFENKYLLIHRPIIRGEAHIWLSFSPDLIHWGGHRILMPARAGWWDQNKVGLGPPPIETPEGWLVIYHGVRTTASGNLYRVGMALLDLEKPWKVIRRSPGWVFAPTKFHEQVGFVSGVIFPTGATLNEDGELKMYYGAADTYVCLATANIRELIDYLKKCPKLNREGVF